MEGNFTENYEDQQTSHTQNYQVMFFLHGLEIIFIVRIKM